MELSPGQEATHTLCGRVSSWRTPVRRIAREVYFNQSTRPMRCCRPCEPCEPQSRSMAAAAARLVSPALPLARWAARRRGRGRRGTRRAGGGPCHSRGTWARQTGSAGACLGSGCPSGRASPSAWAQPCTASRPAGAAPAAWVCPRRVQAQACGQPIGAPRAPAAQQGRSRRARLSSPVVSSPGGSPQQQRQGPQRQICETCTGAVSVPASMYSFGALMDYGRMRTCAATPTRWSPQVVVQCCAAWQRRPR